MAARGASYRTFVLGTALALSALGAAGGSAPARAETSTDPLIVEVGQASGPVGKSTQILASVRIKEGYQLIDPPPRGNRIIELSSADDGVKFARPVFRSRVVDNTLTFKVDVTPTKAGAHPINGLVRVGYVYGTETERKLMQVSIPLISTVVGTE